MVCFQIYHFNCRVVFYCGIFFLFITHVEQPKNNMTSRQWLYVHVYYFYTTTHHLSVWHRGKTCFRYKCLSGKTYSPITHNIMYNHYLLFFMITRCPPKDVRQHQHLCQHVRTSQHLEMMIINFYRGR